MSKSRTLQGITPERWQQVKRIATEALERDPATRAAFVAQACAGDATLQREVNLLLAQDAQSIDELAADARTQMQTEHDPRLIGQRLGAYQILSEIGRGGMGAVYLAQRVDGQFDKKVAIKILKRGTDTDEVLRRFRAERQILARLEHPNIARLLDGGVTDEGLPYFIMEYVAGKPLKEFCLTNAPSIDERLRLFLKICAAVQFAHQNLIVHRDLKPGNILVTEDGEPKLLDFGIAKLLAPGDDALQVTMMEHQRLTPAYASPEQVRGEAITTGSDIYALGTLLYEILTGQNAHRFSTPHPQPTELLRVVAEQEPLRPSAAASDAPTQCRLRGDLDNIILKALRKEPARRYDSVGSLAEDIRRHLENRPVLARQDTLSYRASKFIQRNKLGVAAAVLILLSLLAGVIATSWEAHQARLDKRQTERRFAQVRKLAHSILFDYHDDIAALPGSTKVRARLVRDALEYLDNLSREAGNDTSLLRELAAAYAKVAAVQGGAATSSHALLSLSNLGDTKGALESQLKAMTIWERVSELESTNRTAQQGLATCYGELAFEYLTLGRPDKTVEYEHKAIPLLTSLLVADPASEDLQFLLLVEYLGMSKALGNPGVPNLGDRKGALEYKNKAQVVAEKLVADHPTNVDYQLPLGSLHNMAALMTNDPKEALSESLKTIAIYEGLVKTDAPNTTYRRQLAVELGNAASFMLKLEDKSGALEKVKQAQGVYESLMQADPNDASIRGSAALNYRKLGSALGANGDHAGALGNFQKAQQMFAELVAQDPNNAEFRRQWAYAYLAMSRFHLEAGEVDNAVASATQGIKVEEVLVVASPTNTNAQNTLTLLYSQLGESEAKLASNTGTSIANQDDAWRAAKQAFQKSLDIYQAMKSKGTLAAADAGKADELAREIARCNAALQRYESLR